MQPTVDRARKAGATFLGGVALHLRDEVRDVFFGWLEAKRPDLLPRYEKLYANGRAYLPPATRRQVTSVVKGWSRSRAGRRERESPVRKLAHSAHHTRKISGHDLRRVDACPRERRPVHGRFGGHRGIGGNVGGSVGLLLLLIDIVTKHVV